MTAEELINRFYFHDSTIIDMKHRGNALILTIDLCMYMQRNYRDGDPELKRITAEFIGVSDFKTDTRIAAENSEILEFSFKHNTVKLVLLNDEVSVVEFGCSEVIVGGN